MPSATAISNPTGHPARFSGAIVDKLRAILLDRAPIPYIFDPFAGTGERLAEILGDDFEGGGIELHREFIVNRKLVKVGDATKARSYPRRPFVVVTSPVYPNGMAEGWNVSPDDKSTRNTYSAALTKLGGVEMTNDMTLLGYRGTRRDGRSVKRATYWHLADQVVQRWAESPCEGVFLNVSDFLSGGEVEPFVQDWRHVLRRHGFKISHTYKVPTPRNKGNQHADQRLDYESIVVVTR